MRRYPIRTPGPDIEGFVSLSYLVEAVEVFHKPGARAQGPFQKIEVRVPDGAVRPMVFRKGAMPLEQGHRASMLYAVGPDGDWCPLVFLNHTTGGLVRLAPRFGWARGLGLTALPGRSWRLVYLGWALACLLGWGWLELPHLRVAEDLQQVGLEPALSAAAAVLAWRAGQAGLALVRRAGLLERAIADFEQGSLARVAFMA